MATIPFADYTGETLTDFPAYVYVDKNVVNNGHYNYTISAVANSESGYKDPGKDTTFYAAPAINSVTTNDGSITISWGVVETITGYRVQRKVDDGNWADVSSSQTTRTYTDSNVTSGKKYTYRFSNMFSVHVIPLKIPHTL